MMKNKNMSLLKMSNLTESLNRKYRLDESYSTNDITLDKMKSDIQKAKNRLKKQKPRENFGQNEVRKIEDKYSSLQLDYYSDYSKLINDFIDWCGTYTFNESCTKNKYSKLNEMALNEMPQIKTQNNPYTSHVQAAQNILAQITNLSKHPKKDDIAHVYKLIKYNLEFDVENNAKSWEANGVNTDSLCKTYDKCINAFGDLYEKILGNTSYWDKKYFELYDLLHDLEVNSGLGTKYSRKFANESYTNEDYGEDKYSLVGQDGNAFALMGYTARCMKECGLRDEIDEMRERATESDYDNLIMVCDEYVQRCNDIARDGFEESLNESISKRIHLTAQPGITFELYVKRPGGPDPSMHGIDKFDEELEEPLDCGYINIGSILNNYKSEDDLIEHLGIAVEKKLKNSLTKLWKQKIRRVSFVTVEVSEVKDYLYINNVTYDEFIKNITKENFEESLSAKKVVGRTWREFITNIENETKYVVDSAYKNRPEDWIILIDDKGNMYDAEVTKYYRGGYELMLYNITPQR